MVGRGNDGPPEGDERGLSNPGFGQGGEQRILDDKKRCRRDEQNGRQHDVPRVGRRGRRRFRPGRFDGFLRADGPFDQFVNGDGDPGLGGGSIGVRLVPGGQGVAPAVTASMLRTIEHVS
jgi:hypothetical protein